MTLAEFPQVQALSVREKLELVDEIWKSVSASSDSLEVTQEEKDILDEVDARTHAKMDEIGSLWSKKKSRKA